jgi:hypothetical protein
MQRTSERVATKEYDVAPLLRAIQYLDEALKRGVVIGIFDGSMEVSDEDITKGCASVKRHLNQVRDDLDLLVGKLSAKL